MLLLGNTKNTKLTISLFIGNILYWISDTIIGRVQLTDLKIFGSDVANSVIIMTTYYLAQYMIVLSIDKIELDYRLREERDNEIMEEKI